MIVTIVSACETISLVSYKYIELRSELKCFYRWLVRLQDEIEEKLHGLCIQATMIFLFASPSVG